MSRFNCATPPKDSWPRLRAAVRLSRPDQVLLILAVFAAGWVSGVRGDPAGTSAPAIVVLLIGFVVGAVAISVHAVNEYADVETDAMTERTRFSGGSGALAAHGLTSGFALHIAVGAGAVAVAVTATAWVTGLVPGLVAAMLAGGLAGGWAYSVGPYPFSRHGWARGSTLCSVDCCYPRPARWS